MKRWVPRVALILCLTGCAHGSAVLHQATTPPVSPVPAGQIRGTIWAGAARVEITPPVGTPLAGYARRRGRPSRGVHDPLYARALALSDGEHVVVLVSAEILIIDQPLYEAALARIEERYRVGREGFLLWATHTHSGSGAYGQCFLEQRSMGRYDQRVFDALSRAIAEAAIRAVEVLAPAAISGGETTVEGASWNRVVDGGPTDPFVRVLRVDHRTGQPLARLVTFAAHPTVLSAANRDFSGDYPGVLMRAVETKQPGSVCLFAAGAIGDQAPVYGAEDRFTESQRLGERLAAAALEAVTEKAAVTDGRIKTVVEDLPLPDAHLRVGRLRLPSWLSRRFVESRTPLHLVAVDRWLLIGAPCDLGVEVAAEIAGAAHARGRHPIFIGFAEDYIGYVLPATAYASNTYEARMHFYGPRIADTLTRAVIAMMDTLTPVEEHATTTR